MENERYVKKEAIVSTPAKASSTEERSVPSVSATQSGGAPDMINMYLSMYGMGGSATAPTPTASSPRQSAPTTNTPRATATKESAPMPKKIYLRVPDMSGEVFQKAKNMVDIFNEGTITVIFYDSSTAKYSEYSERMFYSEYAIKELKGIIGEDNVVLK